LLNEILGFAALDSANHVELTDHSNAVQLPVNLVPVARYQNGARNAACNQSH
jgi:hypothetical protein